MNHTSFVPEKTRPSGRMGDNHATHEIVLQSSQEDRLSPPLLATDQPQIHQPLPSQWTEGISASLQQPVKASGVSANATADRDVLTKHKNPEASMKENSSQRRLSNAERSLMVDSQPQNRGECFPPVAFESNQNSTHSFTAKNDLLVSADPSIRPKHDHFSVVVAMSTDQPRYMGMKKDVYGTSQKFTVTIPKNVCGILAVNVVKEYVDDTLFYQVKNVNELENTGEIAEKLQVNDVIVAVNDVSIRHMDIVSFVALCKSKVNDCRKFTLVRATHTQQTRPPLHQASVSQAHSPDHQDHSAAPASPLVDAGIIATASANASQVQLISSTPHQTIKSVCETDGSEGKRSLAPAESLVNAPCDANEDCDENPSFSASASLPGTQLHGSKRKETTLVRGDSPCKRKRTEGHSQATAKVCKERSGYSSFVKKLKAAKRIEYGPTGMNQQTLNGIFWNLHKTDPTLESNCSDSCRCVMKLHWFCEHVPDEYVTNQLKKDSSWKIERLSLGSGKHPVGFMSNFAFKFMPKLENEYPDESPARLLERLTYMWSKHERHRSYGIQCSDACPCEEGWDHVFHKGATDCELNPSIQEQHALPRKRGQSDDQVADGKNPTGSGDSCDMTACSDPKGTSQPHESVAMPSESTAKTGKKHKSHFEMAGQDRRVVGADNFVPKHQAPQSAPQQQSVFAHSPPVEAVSNVFGSPIIPMNQTEEARESKTPPSFTHQQNNAASKPLRKTRDTCGVSQLDESEAMASNRTAQTGKKRKERSKMAGRNGRVRGADKCDPERKAPQSGHEKQSFIPVSSKVFSGGMSRKHAKGAPILDVGASSKVNSDKYEPKAKAPPCASQQQNDMARGSSSSSKPVLAGRIPRKKNIMAGNSTDWTSHKHVPESKTLPSASRENNETALKSESNVLDGRTPGKKTKETQNRGVSKEHLELWREMSARAVSQQNDKPKVERDYSQTSSNRGPGERTTGVRGSEGPPNSSSHCGQRGQDFSGGEDLAEAATRKSRCRCVRDDHSSSGISGWGYLRIAKEQSFVETNEAAWV